MALIKYSVFYSGEHKLTLPVVCQDGVTRIMHVEEYTDGFHAFVMNNGDKLSNHEGYKTTREALSAASKWKV